MRDIAHRARIAVAALLAALLATTAACGAAPSARTTSSSAAGAPRWRGEQEPMIDAGDLRKEVYALVSSAENSTIEYRDAYRYIEDIGDGRGYTAGIIGFTSRNGDLLDVVELYTRLEPDNALAPYIPALEQARGTDAHTGLGEGFERAWKACGATPKMVEAQDRIVDEQYMGPAIRYAKEDHLAPLGQYVYYDALVVHGPGDDEDSFGGIRARALADARTPAQGGDEAAYLEAFLDARANVMGKEAAHADLSRLDVQRAFIKDGDWDLTLPLRWTMYGDRYTLTRATLDADV